LSDLRFSSSQAQLFRQLMDVFGADRVLPNLHVSMICGQSYPPSLTADFPELPQWAKSTICLFTVIDGESDPRMVIDIFDGFEESIDVKQEERQRYLPLLFSGINVHYITLGSDEIASIGNTGNREMLCAILEQKIQKTKSV